MYDDNVPHYPTKYRATLQQRLEYLETCIAKSAPDDKRVGFQERECQALRHVLAGGSVDPDHAARLSLTSCVRRVRRLLLDAPITGSASAINPALREIENALMSLAKEPIAPPFEERQLVADEAALIGVTIHPGAEPYSDKV